MELAYYLCLGKPSAAFKVVEEKHILLESMDCKVLSLEEFSLNLFILALHKSRSSFQIL